MYCTVPIIVIYSLRQTMREHTVNISDKISLVGLFFMQESRLVTFTVEASVLNKCNNITCSR